MYDLIIIGSGPAGLSCGISAKKNGLNYVILEKGGITENIRRFPRNMIFFSTPELLELDNIPFSTPNVRPNRVETLNYYRKILTYYELNVKLYTPVSSIQKKDDFFAVETEEGGIFHSKFVVIATGYFDNTNKLGCVGEDLAHVTHFYDEAFAYSGTKVAVIGGRNSAVETALELFRAGADVTMIHRKDKLRDSVKYWIRPDIDNRLKNGEINAFFNSVVKEIRLGSLDIENVETGEKNTLNIDFVVAHIGYRPDEKLLRSTGVNLDAKTLRPEFNPATFETNVKNLYIAGSVAGGTETGTVFIENGREHAKTIIVNICNGSSH